MTSVWAPLVGGSSGCPALCALVMLYFFLFCFFCFILRAVWEVFEWYVLLNRRVIWLSCIFLAVCSSPLTVTMKHGEFGLCDLQVNIVSPSYFRKESVFFLFLYHLLDFLLTTLSSFNQNNALLERDHVRTAFTINWKWVIWALNVSFRTSASTEHTAAQTSYSVSPVKDVCFSHIISLFKCRGCWINISNYNDLQQKLTFHVTASLSSLRINMADRRIISQLFRNYISWSTSSMSWPLIQHMKSWNCLWASEMWTNALKRRSLLSL